MQLLKTRRPAGERLPQRHYNWEEISAKLDEKTPEPQFHPILPHRKSVTWADHDQLDWRPLQLPPSRRPKPTTVAIGRRPATIFWIASERIFFYATRIWTLLCVSLNWWAYHYTTRVFAKDSVVMEKSVEWLEHLIFIKRINMML
jgi:hypothetical protein